MGRHGPCGTVWDQEGLHMIVGAAWVHLYRECSLGSDFLTNKICISDLIETFCQTRTLEKMLKVWDPVVKSMFTKYSARPDFLRW